MEDSYLNNNLFIQILNDKNNFVISKLPYIPANGMKFLVKMKNFSRRNFEKDIFLVM